MTTMHVAFVKLTNDNSGVPTNIIEQVLSAQTLTTVSSPSAESVVCPSGANAALVWPVDAAVYVVGGEAAPDAGATDGIYLGTGTQGIFRMKPGWKISVISA